MSDDKPPAKPALHRSKSSMGAAVALGAAGLAAAWRMAWRAARRAATGVICIWRGLDARRKRILTGALAIVAALLTVVSWRDVPQHWWEARQGRRPLLAAKNWHYNLSSIEVDRLVRQPAGLLVIDFARDDGSIPLTKDEVARIKAGADGKPRLVVSYISIGEGESYRFYWNRAWDTEAPPWHVAENCAWPRNHMVRFWHDGWKDIIFRGQKSYLGHIIEAGFDGVYLDRIDVYGNLEMERPGARGDMVQFIREMAETARKLKPGFLVIAQNAESLLADRGYRNLIDGLGKEDLLYGAHGTDKRNTPHEIAANARLIRKLQWDYKPVFAVEYLTRPSLIEEARRELTGLDLVPTFAHRTLDGRDPLQPRAPKSFDYGTAEWIAKNCQGKPHW